MKLWEALKTGKRFRNQFFIEWCIWSTKNRYTFEAAHLDDDRWEVEPDPRPRLLAWRCKDKASEMYGVIKLVPEDSVFNAVSDFSGDWHRMPHLDEPRTKDTTHHVNYGPDGDRAMSDEIKTYDVCGVRVSKG